MRYVLRPSEVDSPALWPDPELTLTFERREDARLAAERYSGKAVGNFEIIEIDDQGNERRLEEYDFDEGWLSTIK